MGKKLETNDGVDIMKMDPEWRSQRAMDEINAIMEKYACKIEVTHGVVVLPMPVPVLEAELE